MDTAWLIAGMATLGTLLTAAWSYIRAWMQHLISLVIVTVELQDAAIDVFTTYAWQELTHGWCGNRRYTGGFRFMPKYEHNKLVLWELVGQQQLFWCGWSPLWATTSGGDSGGSKSISGLNESAGGGHRSFRVTYFRGTLDFEKLLIEARRIYVGDEDRIGDRAFGEPNCRMGMARRHIVSFRFGTAGKKAMMSGPPGQEAVYASGSTTSLVTVPNRPLGFTAADFAPVSHGTSSLAQLALPTAAGDELDRIKRWHGSRGWYRSRGVPWRRGVLLHGVAGTGKTSLVRALGEDLDLPIYVFDLATMYNDELRREWEAALSNAPVIVLLEDIDNVFHGRANVAGGELTFDCLLNCIDGVRRSDGLLLMVTTNHIEHIDPALGVATESGSSRPGRVDAVIELPEWLDDAGRRLIATRILPDEPELRETLVRQAGHYSGAQFQGLCEQAACEQFWAQTHIAAEKSSATA